MRESIDVLSEQRRAAQDARMTELEAREGAVGGGDDAKGPLGGGGLENDAAMTGVFPPFDKQYPESKTVDATLPSSSAAYSSTITELSLRQIRSSSMGHLVTLRGMVVRASDVKPACLVATYTCDACGCEIYQVVQNKREFLPQRLCPVEECRRASKGGDTLHLQTRGSKFVKFQELRCQELPSQVPMGHVPSSMSVHCRGELTRLASPGDVVTIDGVFLPQRVAESGYRATKAGLVSTSFLEAQNIIIHKKSYEEDSSDYLSEEEKQRMDREIHAISNGEDPVGTLSSAIAPEIFGHEISNEPCCFNSSEDAHANSPMVCEFEEITTCLMGG
eukprot:CCRYP_006334-RA/>CCRYP_006334-RA protein AED:0.26 eAED:0.26 QI:0/0/0/1/1/1/2/0/332